MPSPELSGKSETPLEAYKKTLHEIDRQGAKIHSYYISNQLGNFVERNVAIDSFDTHRGVVDEHGEFELLMIRVHVVNRSLVRDWIILPDGDIWTCGVNRDNPNVLEFDTIECPTSEELIRDQEYLMPVAAIKAGLVWDDDAKEFKQPAVDEQEEATKEFLAVFGDDPEVVHVSSKNIRRGFSSNTKPPVVFDDSDEGMEIAKLNGLRPPRVYLPTGQ